MNDDASKPVRIPLTVLVALAGVAMAACVAPASEPASGGLTDRRIRVVAANLTSGNGQSYDPGHGARILDGLDPDVVLIQEFNYGGNTQAELSDFVTETFGPDYSFYREPSVQIPNGVISRYPILEAGVWNDPRVSNRGFAFARLDVPGDRELWAVSVHFLTANTSERRAEARSLISRVREEVPDADFLVIGGDFNTGSFGESTFDVLAQEVDVDGPHPADQHGNPDTNANRDDPYDRVLPERDLEDLQVPTEIGQTTFEDGAVIDTRVYEPISELEPARAGDSGASNMQHMAVVKDFEVRVDGPGPDAAPPRPDAGAPDAGGPDACLPGDGGARADAARPDGDAVLLLNEVLANEPSGSVGQEFVEIVNAGGAPTDLDGMTLEDGSRMRHVFSATTLEPGERWVVYGSSDSVPASIAGEGASSGALSLSNGGDDVILRDGGGRIVDEIRYGDPLADFDGVSMNREIDADPEAGLVLHTDISADAASPGTSP